MFGLYLKFIECDFKVTVAKAFLALEFLCSIQKLVLIADELAFNNIKKM